MGDLTEAERGAFERDGFFVREGVLGSPELGLLRRAVEAVHARVVEAASALGPSELLDGKRYQRVLDSSIKWEWQADSSQIRSMEPVHHLDPSLDAVLDDPRLWTPLAALLGVSCLSLFTDKLNFKRPGGAPFPWHQDSLYWAFDCGHVDRLGSVQIYLDDATEANGCLWLMPGSHRGGVRAGYTDRGRLARLYTDLEKLEPFQRVPLRAAAGSAIFFNANIVHGSQTNRSGSSRRALVLTYQPVGLPLWRATEHRDIADQCLLGSPAKAVLKPLSRDRSTRL